MPKTLVRIISLLLISCLVEPSCGSCVSGFAFTQLGTRNTQLETVLAEQALSPAAFIEELHPESFGGPDSIARRAKVLQTIAPQPLAVVRHSTWGEILAEVYRGGWNLDRFLEDEKVEELALEYPTLTSLLASRDLEGLRELIELTIAPEQETQRLIIEPVLQLFFKIGQMAFDGEEAVREFIADEMNNIVRLGAAEHMTAFFPGLPEPMMLTPGQYREFRLLEQSWAAGLQDPLEAYALDPTREVSQFIQKLEEHRKRLVQEHWDYNDNVRKRTPGYENKPLAVVPGSVDEAAIRVPNGFMVLMDAVAHGERPVRDLAPYVMKAIRLDRHSPTALIDRRLGLVRFGFGLGRAPDEEELAVRLRFIATEMAKNIVDHGTQGVVVIQKTDRGIQILGRDTGEGISNISKVFEMEFQPGGRGRFSGAGQGLQFLRDDAKAWQGHFLIESLGRGYSLTASGERFYGSPIQTGTLVAVYMPFLKPALGGRLYATDQWSDRLAPLLTHREDGNPLTKSILSLGAAHQNAVKAAA